MKTQAIIPTAGLGTRMRSTIPKTLLDINGVPMIIHTLRAFEKSKTINAVILVVHPDYAEQYRQLVEKYGITKVKEYITGGNTRSESVGNGLTYVDPDCQIIVVHDGARPLITPELIDKTVNLCIIEKAVITGLPVMQTIKKVDVNESVVEKTLNREELWAIQTPQAFYKDVLVEAYLQAKSLDAPDDAALVEQVGMRVKVLLGDPQNIKVTTAEDMIMAEKLLSAP